MYCFGYSALCCRRRLRPACRAPLIGHCGWLGQNIRWLLIGATAIPGWPQGMLWIELIPMNIILIALVMSADRAAARVLSGQAQRRPEPVGAH